MKNSPQQAASDGSPSIQILQGDCCELLKSLPSESVSLIMTSPPFADRRKNTYGGILPDKYVEWFLPIGAELFRVLRPDGSMIVNIKENVVDGQRSTYVLDLILALRKQGWRHPEEYIWHKRNPVPGKWPNRFRDGWERLLQFTKSKHFSMYQDSVRVPLSEEMKRRSENLSERDKKRHNTSNNSGFGINRSNWAGRDLAYPTNVLHLSVVGSNKNHSAVFPEAIPEWFVKLFTLSGDTVLDPFLGSGTTGVVCRRMDRGLYRNRNCPGICQGRPRTHLPPDNQTSFLSNNYAFVPCNAVCPRKSRHNATAVSTLLPSRRQVTDPSKKIGPNG